MKNLWKSTPIVIIMLLAGCKTATLLMKVDPTLEANASVYEVKTPNVWSDEKKLNVSFGAYRVTDMDIGWTKKRNASTSGNFWVDMLTYIPGVSAGGVNRSGDDDDETISDPGETISEISQSLSYRFRAGDEIAWFSECAHVAEKGVTKHKHSSSLRILSSNYICRYTRADNEQWLLSIEQNDLAHADIRMTDGEKSFSARSTAGTYVISDGSSPSKLLRPPDAGYTWIYDNNNVAAISLKEKTTRVWLDKRNSDDMNNVLAMASTGLLIYNRKILPKLKQH